MTPSSNCYAQFGRQAPGQTRRCGFINVAIEHGHADLSGWCAYLCVSPPMVEAAIVLARRKGISAAQIYADVFYT